MVERKCNECNRGILWRSPRRGWREMFLCRMRRLFPWRCGYCGARVLLRDRGEGKPVKAPRAVLKHL